MGLSDDDTGIVTPGWDKDSIRISNSLFHSPMTPWVPMRSDWIDR